MPQKTKKKRSKQKSKRKKTLPETSKKVTSLSQDQVRKINVRIIGIGGGGNSIVSEIASRIKKGEVKFVVANTDRRALDKWGKASKIKRFQFGEALTGGLGTGMNVELAKKAALDEKGRIKGLLEGSDLCIIVACLGGGTGSGAAPLFAKVSKNLDNLTYGIFTLPFKFEGEKKMEIARTSLAELKPHISAFSIIPNERIFKFIDRKTPLKQALSTINEGLAESLEGLIRMIYLPGLVNIDFADFRTIMEGRGKLAYLSTAKTEGEDRAEAVAQKVIFDPLYSYNLSGARRILFNITSDGNLGLGEVGLISRKVFQAVKKDAKIIFGVSRSQKMANRIRVTLLAAGCQGRIFPLASPKPRPKVSEKKSKPPRKKKKKRGQAPKKKTKKGSKKARKLSQPTKKQGSPQPPQPKEEKKTSPPATSPEKSRVTIRRNGLQAKKIAEEIEKEILKKEEAWETPAFLRRRKEVNP